MSGNNTLKLSVEDANKTGTSKHYHDFYYGSDSWVLSKDDKLVFDSELNFDKQVLKEFREVIFWYAENYSPSYTISTNKILTAYILFSNYQISIDSAHLFFLNLKNVDKEFQFTCLRSALKKWHDFYPETVSWDMLKTLNKIKVKGTLKGRPVRSRCPDKGPFTSIERQNIVERLSFAFGEGKISQQNYALVWFFLSTGRRVGQASILKIKDLIIRDDCFFINVPRIKVSKGSFREYFRGVELTKDIYLILKKQKEYVINTVESILNNKLNEKQIQELPFFINQNLFSDISIAEYEADMHKDTFHIKKQDLSTALSSIPKQANIYSERTHKLIHLNSHRFRYTVGCELAKDGASKEEIAYILDHSDTQSVDIYVENPAEFIYELTEKLDQFITPIAKAFKGEIVDPRFKAVKNADKESSIRAADSDLGRCGTNTQCLVDIPVPCYTCQHFRPWRDINIHKKVLIDLMERRERLMNSKVDMNIVTNLDNTILAVSEILSACTEDV